MTPKARRLVLVVVATSTLVITLATVLRHGKHKSVQTRADLSEVYPVISDRLEGQTLKIKRESTQESMAKLSDVNMFYWPGPRGTPQGIRHELPVPKEEGGFDVEAIMSNRRFRKVFEELSAQPQDVASETVRRALSAAVAEYLPLYEAKMRISAPRYKVEVVREKIKNNMATTLPSFEIGNVPEGKVVISGARLNVLSLVWVSGMLKLISCKDGCTAQIVGEF